jgi:hypothetical protein
MRTAESTGEHPSPAESSFARGDEGHLWPRAWWQAGCRLLASLEQRRGIFVAGLAAAVFAESLSFLFASSWYVNHAQRFTGLSVGPFAVGDVPILYPEHRLRLLGPVIAWAVGLGGSIYGTLIPVLANFPLLALAYVFVRQRSSIQMGLLSVVLLSTTHLTMTSRTELGYHDSLVYLCCLGALMARRLPLKAVLLFLALYGDVRAVLVVPFILVWPQDPGDRIPPLPEMAKRAAVCAATAAVWFLSARGLLLAFDYEQVLVERVTDAGFFVEVEMDGEVLPAIDPYILHLSIFMAFKAAWLFVFIPMYTIGRRNRLLAAFLGAAFVAIAVPGFLVHDISRAMVFAFPLILLGFVELYRSSARTALVVAGTCLAVNLASPFYHGMTWGLWVISYPLPVELIRRIF